MIIKRKRGDTYDMVISVVDKSNKAIPLTTEAFTLSVSVEAEPVGSPDIMSVTGVISDALNGKVSFPIAGTEPVGEYYYDIEMVGTDSKTRTIDDGIYILKQDITK